MILALVDIAAKFEPEALKANAKNEAYLVLTLSSSDNEKAYWCECDVNVKPPLSLAHDKELNGGRTKIGILKPGGTINKRIKLFTRPNNFPDDYSLTITAYVYDEDGVISERQEKRETVPCRE